MPRYFFHVRGGGMPDDDEDGTELPSLAAAKREPLRYLGALLADDEGEFWGGFGWCLNVTDADGPLLTMTVSGAVASAR